MPDLNDTEKKLAVIWKQVFSLSTEECQKLDRQSNFLVFTKRFCEKLEYSVNDLGKFNFVNGCVRETLITFVNDKFDIWSEGIADHQTLGEQAVYIDCCLTIKSCGDRPVRMQYKLDKLELPGGMSFLPIFDVDDPKSVT